MARATGLEPATSGVTGRHSNQLSYARAGRLRRLGLSEVGIRVPGRRCQARGAGKIHLPQIPNRRVRRQAQAADFCSAKRDTSRLKLDFIGTFGCSHDPSRAVKARTGQRPRTPKKGRGPVQRWIRRAPQPKHLSRVINRPVRPTTFEHARNGHPHWRGRLHGIAERRAGSIAGFLFAHESACRPKSAHAYLWLTNSPGRGRNDDGRDAHSTIASGTLPPA